MRSLFLGKNMKWIKLLFFFLQFLFSFTFSLSSGMPSHSPMTATPQGQTPSSALLPCPGADLPCLEPHFLLPPTVLPLWVVPRPQK